MNCQKDDFVKVSIFQATPKNSFEERKKQIYNTLACAQKNKVDFVCFSEGFLTGYYSNYKEAFANALKLNDINFLNFLLEAQFFEPIIILGFAEKSQKKLYNSVAIIEKGKLLHVQRKHYLYHNYFTPGSSYLPVMCRGVNIGIVVCLDVNYFEPSHLLALKGAEIIFCPMCNKVPLSHPYSKRPPYYPQFVARSFENRCWLVASDWIWSNDGVSSCPGHSCIYNANGEEVIRSHEFQEELINYSIPKAQLFKKKGKRSNGSETLKKQIYFK